jgi:riboflavin biosynthesis pyrimidine reductase
VDRNGVLPLDSYIFSDDSPTIVYSKNTDWSFVLSDLSARNIHSVLIEGGAILLQSILDFGVYDEVHVEISKHTLPHDEESTSRGVNAPNYIFKTLPKIIDGNKIFVEYR